MMIAARFVYNGVLRVGVVTDNKVTKIGKHRFMRLYHGNGRYKTYRWNKASNIELFQLTELNMQLIGL
jgi:hypothetical protein